MTRCHSLILGYAYKCVVSQQDDNNGRYGGNISRGVGDLAVRVADDEARLRLLRSSKVAGGLFVDGDAILDRILRRS